MRDLPGSAAPGKKLRPGLYQWPQPESRLRLLLSYAAPRTRPPAAAATRRLTCQWMGLNDPSPTFSWNLSTSSCGSLLSKCLGCRSEPRNSESLPGCCSNITRHDLAAVGRQFEPYRLQGSNEIMLWARDAVQLWFEYITHCAFTCGA